MRKQGTNPHKIVAWSILLFIYGFATVALLGTAVPKLLSAYDTSMVITGVCAVFFWGLVTYYMGAMIHKARNKTNTRKRRNARS